VVGPKKHDWASEGEGFAGSEELANARYAWRKQLTEKVQIGIQRGDLMIKSVVRGIRR